MNKYPEQFKVPPKPAVTIESGTFCKGSYPLGTACGKCERCAEEWDKLYGGEKPKPVVDQELPELENVSPLKHISDDDMNIIVLTDEHLQKIITEAVRDGIKQYENDKLADEVAVKLMKMGIVPYGTEIEEKENGDK